MMIKTTRILKGIFLAILNATYLDGIAIRDTKVDDSQSDVISWLNGLGFGKP